MLNIKKENKIMIQEVTDGRVPVKMWLEDLDERAWREVRNLANFPFAYHHIAIMPDGHAGTGMPIGAVLAVKDVIIPNAVGEDAGCGMAAVQTNVLVTELSGATDKPCGEGVRTLTQNCC